MNQGSFKSSNSNGAHPTLRNEIKLECHQPQPPKPPSKMPSSGTNEIQPSIKDDNAIPVSNTEREKRLQSSDILERARAALATAERATASARAAAELLNVKFGSFKLEEGKTS